MVASPQHKAVLPPVALPLAVLPMAGTNALGLRIRKQRKRSIRTYLHTFFPSAKRTLCALQSLPAAGLFAQLHPSSLWQPVFCSRFSMPSSLRSSPGAHHHPLPVAVARCPLPSATSRSGALLMAPGIQSPCHPGLLQLLRNTILLFVALRVHAPAILQQAVALPTPGFRRQAC